jgi:protein ImuB
MPQRRVLSVWFPRLAAERLMRHDADVGAGPLAIVRTENNSQSLASLSAEAEAEGLRPGQPLRDARAFCPALITRPENPVAEAAFLALLRRWAGRFTPYVAEEPPAALMLDITGCAHLFGGEAALSAVLSEDCARMGLTVRTGIADTPGAAWALARFAGQHGASLRNGDAIDQEARATRSRSARRHWTRGGAAPNPALQVEAPVIAPAGLTRQTIAPLPIAALRLSGEAAANLTRLGIRRIDDLSGLPRAALARRFGRDVVRRLDQAVGVEPEPISPARHDLRFATRLSLPEPIGLEGDLIAAIDRLLPPLCAKLHRHGRGMRRLRMDLFQTDRSQQSIEAGLARPSHDPEQIRPLILLKLAGVDPGFGIDTIRLEAIISEPLPPRQHSGQNEALGQAQARRDTGTRMDDLITRLGGRIGLEAITRLHPADSHIPEKTATIMAAAFAEPAGDWPRLPVARPLVMFPPEIVTTDDPARPPLRFRWRRRDFETESALGPERLAPEWWLDDPNWRSGLRDYWRLETTSGERLWLYYAHGALGSGGWFCQGAFG